MIDRTGVLVLAATPDRPGRRRPAAAGGRAHRRRRGRGRGHPPAQAADQRPRASRSTGRVVSYFEGNESARTPVAARGAARRRARRAGHRRRDAERLRPRLPPRRRGRRARHPRHGRARAQSPCSPRWRSRACRSTGSASRASCRARRGSGRRRLAGLAARGADDGVLRGAAPHRGGARRDGRGARWRPRGRRVPRADQDPRGGTPRAARRPRRLGRRRRARRGDHRGRGRRCRPPRRHRPRVAAGGRRRGGGRRARPARRRSPRSPAGPASQAGGLRRGPHAEADQSSRRRRPAAGPPPRRRSGSRRDRERPPAPEPLPHPVVDNHCHLDIADGEWLATSRGPRRWPRSVNVTRIVQIGCDLPGARWAVEAAAAEHPSWSPGSRCTPTRRPGSGDLDEAMAEIEALAGAHDQVRAVGETGLDYFRTGEEGRAVQQETFRRHIDLAKRLDKTLVIHDRDAHDDVLRVIDEEGAPERWVMHCFSGDADFARRLPGPRRLPVLRRHGHLQERRQPARRARGRRRWTGSWSRPTRRTSPRCRTAAGPTRPTSCRSPCGRWPRCAGTTSRGSARPSTPTPRGPSAAAGEGRVDA